MTPHPISRRRFLLLGFGWFSRRRYVTLAGIPFEVLRRGRSSRRFLVIHGNEQTAREVLLARMRTGAPALAHLAAGKERYVPIGPVKFDPNRIFSREGAERNLKLVNPEADPARLRAVLAMLDREREKLLRALLPPPGGLLVTLHNNSEGYSVLDEVPISDEVRLADRANPREFFLCTDPADYRILAGSPYNVVLQNRTPRQDDGSLSRLAARRGVRYVNIEAALGNYEKQREMLAWLEHHLPETRSAGGRLTAVPRTSPPARPGP